MELHHLLIDPKRRCQIYPWDNHFLLVHSTISLSYRASSIFSFSSKPFPFCRTQFLAWAHLLEEWGHSNLICQISPPKDNNQGLNGNLTQSQMRICANETAVLVTMMLSLKGSINAPVIFSSSSSSPGQTQRLQV